MPPLGKGVYRSGERFQLLPDYSRWVFRRVCQWMVLGLRGCWRGHTSTLLTASNSWATKSAPYPLKPTLPRTIAMARARQCQRRNTRGIRVPELQIPVLRLNRLLVHREASGCTKFNQCVPKEILGLDTTLFLVSFIFFVPCFVDHSEWLVLFFIFLKNKHW